jgi:hypothetical protein
LQGLSCFAQAWSLSLSTDRSTSARQTRRREPARQPTRRSRRKAAAKLFGRFATGELAGRAGSFSPGLDTIIAMAIPPPQIRVVVVS